MLNKFGKTKRITIIAGAFAALALILLSVSVGVVYAAYTHSRSAQRVVAAYETMSELFSSNYLLNVSVSSKNVRSVFVSDSANPPVAGVTVCNYVQKNPGKFFDADIGYTLSAKLVKWNENAKLFEDASAGDAGEYTITVGNGTSDLILSGSALSGSFRGSIEGGRAAANSYTVTFSNGVNSNFIENTPNLYLELVATPDSGLGLSAIRGVFRADLRVYTGESGWSGMFSDGTDVLPSAYAGFNYLITGVGSGNCTLTWDPSKLELSQVSLLGFEDAEVTVSNGLKSITFDVDSTGTSRYELQFYKSSGFPDPGNAADNWTDVGGYVTLSYSETP